MLCEGPSEERFVKDILAPYLSEYQVYLIPIILGGVSRYAGIRKELKRIGKDSSSYLTTMLDYYGLPQDVLGVIQSNDKEITLITEIIEDAIKKDLCNELQCKGFFPNIIMHEYEALLFSDVNAFHVCEGMAGKVISQLKKET